MLVKFHGKIILNGYIKAASSILSFIIGQTIATFQLSREIEVFQMKVNISTFYHKMLH